MITEELSALITEFTITDQATQEIQVKLKDQELHICQGDDFILVSPKMAYSLVKIINAVLKEH